MVSLMDVDSLRVPGADFVELLLFDGDDERLAGAEDALVTRLRRSRTMFVHCQEFIRHAGRAVLVDLSSEDDGLRAKSIEAVELARSIARSIGGAKVVVHPGGIRSGRGDRQALLTNLSRSLGSLGPEALLLENMPWYYWEKGAGQRVANLCVDLADMLELRGLVEGFTLDTSHGYLSRTEGDDGYCGKFMASFGEQVMHIHASDAKAPDREGMQIGEGDIDFGFLADAKVPILAEIWNGHENGGEGFRAGIERLRSLVRGEGLEPRKVLRRTGDSARIR